MVALGRIVAATKHFALFEWNLKLSDTVAVARHSNVFCSISLLINSLIEVAQLHAYFCCHLSQQLMLI